MAILTFGHPMAKVFKLNISIKVRLYTMYSLTFLVVGMLNSCENHQNKIELVWKNKRATGIQIPKHLLKDFSITEPNSSLKIVLLKATNQGILGNFVSANTSLIFEPLIPLTPGLTYHILQNNAPIGEITVPFDESEQAPALISIYPETDTLPENTLKFYFRFSKPMRTGQSLQFICLLDKNKDTLRNIFLNLQPELWDSSTTVYTLWLDPGRIKRGLVLNKELGNPLKTKERYQLVVSQQWRDNRGLKLAKQYTKEFLVGKWDNKVPDISQWQLNLPKAGVSTPLIINTYQPLDHYLLQESISIIDKNGMPVKGSISISAKDKLWYFSPSESWKAENYRLRVNALLEDLAGNNLNRVFDRDITKEKKKNNAYYELAFDLKP